MEENKKELVEVVRCGECMYYARYRIGDSGFCILHDEISKANWFCADGTKKEESET